MDGLLINGTYHSAEEMSKGISTLNKPEEQTLSDFLQEWYNNEAFIIGHTSGSTGTPKELRLRKTDMLASARLTNQFFKINRKSRLLLCLSPAYIAGKMMIVRTIEAHAELIALPPSSLPFAELTDNIDLAAVVPMQLDSIEIQLPGLQKVRQLLIGGAPISPTLDQRLQPIDTACYATYGMTETVSHIALKRLNGTKKQTSFFALGNIHFETDIRGCLTIHAPHLTEQRFVTNDLVILADKHHFEWLGRYDHIINSGGVKLSPEKIEKCLATVIPGRFYITSEPDERLGQQIVLVIEGKIPGTEQLEKWQTEFTRLLSRFETPRNIRFVPKFRETYSGKIIRD